MEFKVDFEVDLPEQIFDARFHPANANSLIVAGDISGDVHVVKEGAVVNKLKKHHKGSPIRKVRFDGHGNLVTIAKTVKIHDLEANETKLTIRREDDFKATLYSIKPFGNDIICAGDDDGRVYVWDTRTPEKSIFTSAACEQYISDIDGKYEGRKLMVCTSGEGTLTAYDLRTMKMIEPQSEVFEAGFQCVKMVEPNRKIVIGGEDGAIYVFNQGEWAHTSGKFAISSDLQNRGKCSIDCLDVLPDESTFIVGCSDGRMRTLTLWPHAVLSERPLCKKASLESIHVNPNESMHQVVVSGENHLNIVSYEECNEEMDEDKDSENESTPADSATSADQNNEESSNEPDQKKLKTDTDDYLNVFH